MIAATLSTIRLLAGILLAGILLAGMLMAQSQPPLTIQIDQANNHLVAINTGDKLITAFIMRGKWGGYPQIDDIPPHETVTFTLDRTDVDPSDITIDALFADGTVAGPNKWGIDRHYNLRRGIFSGQPVMAMAARYDEAGDAVQYAYMWARQYKLRTGLDSHITVYRGPPRGVTPDTGLSYLILGSWQTQGFQDGELDVAGYQNCYEEQDDIYQASSCTCMGEAACTQPNPEIPGKTMVRVSEYAFSTCPGASIKTFAILTNSPPVGSGLEMYLVPYAEADLQFISGTLLTRWSFDSCVTAPYSNGSIVTTTCSN